ncbi:MAG: 3-phosphoshikimate 1-carboxyvinyltransferase [Candidatus Binatia bacterium]
MTTLVVRGPASISGEVSVPGDKSISHRALMFAAIARGRSSVWGLGPGDDIVATRSCLEALGVAVDGADPVTIEGAGLRSWSAAAASLDCRNSGTTMRLLAGLCAHHDFETTLDGDASLRRRPMDRIVRPLRALGAEASARDDRFAPVTVHGGKLHGAAVDTGVASAQVKSCAILAGLAASADVVVTEPYPTRDHTERMLGSLGVGLETERLPDGRNRVSVVPGEPRPFDLSVPGDPSSAAFVVAAGVLGGSVRIDGVCLNPGRIGFLEALRRMGASVRYEVTDERMGEPVGWIEAERSELHGIGIEGPVVPTLHDELPLLAVLATQAQGTTVVEGASELRVKESDRVTAISDLLGRLGARVTERPDGFVVEGPVPLHGAVVDARGDHRMAMTAAVAGLAASGETCVEGFDCAAVSWPAFADVLTALGGDVEEVG